MQSELTNIDEIAVPPHEYHVTIAGNPQLDAADFLNVGRSCADAIRDILSKNGAPIESFTSVLDFGCGVGRVIRHFQNLPNTHFHGTDINPKLIEWCQGNITFAQFSVNSPVPPLTYCDQQFDLIYAFSVFTHLPVSLQNAWMKEFSRVLKPGGRIIITTHGRAYGSVLSDADAEQLNSHKFIIYNEADATNPETYGNCNGFHPKDFMRRKIVEPNGFKIMDHHAGEVHDAAKRMIGQDVYLICKERSILKRFFRRWR